MVEFGTFRTRLISLINQARQWRGFSLLLGLEVLHVYGYSTVWLYWFIVSVTHSPCDHHLHLANDFELKEQNDISTLFPGKISLRLGFSGDKLNVLLLFANIYYVLLP